MINKWFAAKLTTSLFHMQTYVLCYLGITALSLPEPAGVQNYTIYFHLAKHIEQAKVRKSVLPGEEV